MDSIEYCKATIRAIRFHGKRLNCNVSQVSSNIHTKITWTKKVNGEKQKCTFTVYNHGTKDTYLEHMHRIDALESAIYGNEK